MRLLLDSYNNLTFYFRVSEGVWRNSNILRVGTWAFAGVIIGGIAWLLGRGVVTFRDLGGRASKGKKHERVTAAAQVFIPFLSSKDAMTKKQINKSDEVFLIAEKNKIFIERIRLHFVSSRAFSKTTLEKNGQLKYVVWKSESKPGFYGIQFQNEIEPHLIDGQKDLEIQIKNLLIRRQKIVLNVNESERLSIAEKNDFFIKKKFNCLVDSRASSKNTLEKNDQLTYVIWKSESKPGFYGVQFRNEKKPYLIDGQKDLERQIGCLLVQQEDIRPLHNSHY